MTIFVVVGNKYEFEEFKHSRKLTKGVFCVNHPKALEGRRITEHDTVVFAGTALQRRDIDRIMRAIERCKQ